MSNTPTVHHLTQVGNNLTPTLEVEIKFLFSKYCTDKDTPRTKHQINRGILYKDPYHMTHMPIKSITSIERPASQQASPSPDYGDH